MTAPNVPLPEVPMSTIHFAQTSNFAFVDDLMRFGEDYVPQVGDVVDAGEVETTSGEPFEGESAVVLATGETTVVLKDLASGGEQEAVSDGYFYITSSPTISGVWDKHLQVPTPDGVAFADGLVDPGLVHALRADVQRLMDLEPVDYHPNSGTKVRDLVHPSLYPYVDGKSVRRGSTAPTQAPSHDRFGRPFEGSRYQWLPTPFHVADNGDVTITDYINNLDRSRHPSAYAHLASLFSTALPLIESVVGYVDGTHFFDEGVDNESDLPDSADRRQRPATPTSLRGRDLLVIPKIVEYRLGSDESHEGVWHVEGMSHEHIVATCVYVLDRDDTLEGGSLSFKRSYTVEEAGHLFWNISQGRPAPVEHLVNEGTIPLGTVETPAGRLIVFPNSHIHRLNLLSLTPGATEGRRRVIVFWLVDPSLQGAMPSTRDVAEQQSVFSHEEALAIRLELMDERRRHKQSLNVRVVSLCEH